jgi:hypothetical protein
MMALFGSESQMFGSISHRFCRCILLDVSVIFRHWDAIHRRDDKIEVVIVLHESM